MGDRLVMSHDDPFQLEAALRATEGNRQVLGELAGILRAQVPDSLAGLQQAVAERDGAALARQAHQMAGALGLFGADPALKLTRQLETLAKAADWDHIPLLAKRLEGELHRLVTALEPLTTAP